jgi:hypothetical protein
MYVTEESHSGIVPMNHSNKDGNSSAESGEAEKDLMQRHLAGIDAALAAFAGAYTKATRKRRKMSAKSRAKIAAAQRARWAKSGSQSRSRAI